jgi:hypothetical protein
MIYPGEGKKGEPKAGDYVLAAEQTRAEAAASPHQSTAFDLARADKWEGQARTKQLPSTRTEPLVSETGYPFRELMAAGQEQPALLYSEAVLN